MRTDQKGLRDKKMKKISAHLKDHFGNFALERKWLYSHNKNLNNRTPIELIGTGQVDRVLEVAEKLCPKK